MFDLFERIVRARGDHLVQTGQPDLHAPNRLLQGFLEGAPERHDLADRFHLRGQAIIGPWKFLKGKTRNFGDDIVNAGFKRGRAWRRR